MNLETDDFSVNETGGSEEKNPSTPKRSRTYELLVTSPDALKIPLSYSRLVEVKANKLGYMNLDRE